MRPYDSSEALLRILSAPRRNHFFYGKRMDVQHFVVEQNYGKLKQWLLNRLTLGKGVICGLNVSVDGDRVCVDPGVAIDGLGREIVVPVRACIDPLATDDGCCGRHGAPAAAATPPAADASRPGAPLAPPAAATPRAGADLPRPAAPATPAGRPTSGIYTLWLCYHECLADHQPVLVSDCNTRDLCAAGTVVETFCLKASPGMPPVQGDPDWCAVLWGKDAAGTNAAGDVAAGTAGASHTMLPIMGAGSGDGATTPNSSELSDDNLATIKAVEKSRRHALCELFDKACDPPDGDACVPLALVILRDGKLTVEDCVVRPRIYSNAVLLDLILCLAEKIDECCGKHAAELMRVASIDFIVKPEFRPEQLVASVQSPLQDTEFGADRGANALRVRFSMPFAQDKHIPATHGPGDADYLLRNVQILPVDPQQGLPYVPGTLTLESSTNVRFDPTPGTPYALANGAWTKGRYKIFLRGTEDLAKNEEALANTSGQALDGEAMAPAGGVMSGDGTAGGDFTTFFVVVDAAAPRQTLRVEAVDFVNRTGDGEQVVASVKTPKQSLTIQKPFTAIRMRFNVPFDQAGDHKPTTAAANEADFQVHNVLVLPRDGPGYVAGAISVEDARTYRFDAAPPTNRGRTANWPSGIYRLVLRGTADAANKRLALGEPDGTPLDGEPITPAGGVMSGDGQPGGDFSVQFTVRIG